MKSKPVRDVASRTGRSLPDLLVLPGLFAYGTLVDPLTGEGGFPCLWKALFGFDCPGCGLSRATGFLVRGAVEPALAANWLIVLVVVVAAQRFWVGMLFTYRQRRLASWQS
jgi:hypothetical protein